MFGCKIFFFFIKVEVNNMLCHHNSSRLREVIFQASRRIIVKSDKLQKKFLKLKKNIIILNFCEKIYHDPHSNTQYL